MHTHIHAFNNHTYVQKYRHSNIFMQLTPTYIHIHTYTKKQTHLNAYTLTFIQTHIHILCMYACIHTCMNTGLDLRN